MSRRGNGYSQAGSREVEPHKKRKRKRSPSDLARKARRVASSLEIATGEREDGWRRGGRANEFAATRRDERLANLQQDKRTASA